MDKIFNEGSDGISFNVSLTPGSKHESINGVVFDEDNNALLKISVNAKPVNNQANEALIKFISSQFKIAKTNVIIKKGFKSRNKQIYIRQMKIKDIPDGLKEVISRLDKTKSLFSRS